MFGQYTTEDSNKEQSVQADLVSSFGRKVLYCSGCMTAKFEEPIVTHTVNKKEVKCCPHCGDHLVMRNTDRISESTLGRPIGDLKSKHTWAVRLMGTPWGKLRFAVSTHMNQCYNAYFMPLLMDSGKRDHRGNVIMHLATPVPTVLDSIWYYPATNAAMIKELINDDFSDESIYSAWEKLDGHKIGLVQFSRFLDQLKDIVTSVHMAVNPARELDLDTEAA